MLFLFPSLESVKKMDSRLRIVELCTKNLNAAYK